MGGNIRFCNSFGRSLVDSRSWPLQCSLVICILASYAGNEASFARQFPNNSAPFHTSMNDLPTSDRLHMFRVLRCKYRAKSNEGLQVYKFLTEIFCANHYHAVNPEPRLAF